MLPSIYPSEAAEAFVACVEVMTPDQCAALTKVSGLFSNKMKSAVAWLPRHESPDLHPLTPPAVESPGKTPPGKLPIGTEAPHRVPSAPPRAARAATETRLLDVPVVVLLYC